LQARRLEGVPLLLTLLDGEVYAYRDGCPPGSALTLQLGSVEETTLTCPWHGCRYDLRTGKREDGEGKLPVLPVAVQDGEVKVALGTEEVEAE
jgi:nitrite reductase/ring-hydroxylating ferredoxin subunit